MRFIRSRIELNEIVIYYQTDTGKIKKKKYPYNRLIPLTHKRKYKKYPADSVSTNTVYETDCDFKYELYFNDIDFF